jgi:4-hydroxy-3-methylbut-2-enyl diphosphate reductase
MEIVIARPAGTCYGVERALRLAREAAREADPKTTVASLGELIHNPQAVDNLRLIGVEVARSPEDLPRDNATLIIRSHGVAPAVLNQARECGLTVVDATCPHVARAQEAAAELAELGYRVVIVGEPDHPEVRGIRARAGADALVLAASDPPPKDLAGARVGVVIQTTQTPDALTTVVEHLRDLVAELRVVNTICNATTRRQQAALALAEQSDVMIVVGGHNSGNTRRLFELSQSVNPRTYRVEVAHELKQDWFTGATRVGVTAGASTPEEQLQSVVARIRGIEAETTTETNADGNPEN